MLEDELRQKEKYFRDKISVLEKDKAVLQQKLEFQDLQ